MPRPRARRQSLLIAVAALCPWLDQAHAAPRHAQRPLAAVIPPHPYVPHAAEVIPPAVAAFTAAARPMDEQTRARLMLGLILLFGGVIFFLLLLIVFNRWARRFRSTYLDPPRERPPPPPPVDPWIEAGRRVRVDEQQSPQDDETNEEDGGDDEADEDDGDEGRNHAEDR